MRSKEQGTQCGNFLFSCIIELSIKKPEFRLLQGGEHGHHEEKQVRGGGRRPWEVRQFLEVDRKSEPAWTVKFVGDITEQLDTNLGIVHITTAKEE